MGDLLDLLDADLPSSGEAHFQDLILGAQEGSIKELSILARMLAFLPEPLPDQIHLIFLNHLNSSGIPIKPKSDIVDVDEKRAFWSLWALAQLEDVFSDPDPISTGSTDLCGEELVEAWPGIFKWSAYFYSFRVQVSIRLGIR
ncbi:hypothetical protein BDN72DRAFT_966438 [Pluteus cervinus]|uniref:Uncharacterized protein n=1 Tax=Pluteus cervinus TaxID=181527 RepID=A0ACD2ZY78_9AGAR|nr:hypothetical protein BDN72DRAFT_966438 [Pluteus cervinus]